MWECQNLFICFGLLLLLYTIFAVVFYSRSLLFVGPFPQSALEVVKDRTLTLVLLHLAVFLAGWTGIFGRMISLSGFPLVWWRVMVAVPSLIVCLSLLKRMHKVIPSKALKIAFLGIILSLHWVAFYASIQASNVSIGVTCIATSSFFTTIFDPLINRKRFSFVDAVISFIAIAGVLLIFSLDIRYRLGIALGLLSAALYSVFSILNINVSKSTGEDSGTMLLYELVGGVVFLSLVMPLYSLIFPSEPVVPTGKDILCLVLLGSVFTVVPFMFQLMALRRLSAFTVNLTYNLEPLYSILFAALIFGETREVGFSFWMGIFLVVVSVAVQTVRVRRAPE